jgi:hypothetical protein
MRSSPARSRPRQCLLEQLCESAELLAAQAARVQLAHRPMVDALRAPQRLQTGSCEDSEEGAAVGRVLLARD